MEAQHVLRLFDADLVIAEVLNVLDAQVDANVDSRSSIADFHQVADLADGVVAGGDVEDAGNAVVRLNGADVRGRRIFDARGSAARWTDC